MSKREPPALAKLLAHKDMRVRQAAQFELAARGKASIAMLSEVATADDATTTTTPTTTSTTAATGQQLARIHAMWALGQIGRTSPDALKALAPLLNDRDEEIRAQAARLAGDGKLAAASDRLIALLKDPSPRVRFMAAIALGKLKVEAAIVPLLAMLQENDNKDAYLRH